MKSLLKSLAGPVLASVLTALLVAGSANGAMWQWSKTAATNATADPSINYSEGQSPSSINDSARAAMARTAEYRDDISGALTTAGTSSAYTLTTNQGLGATPVTGQLIAFKVSATNADSATLRVDGGTVYPIQTSSGVAVTAGTLISGSPYTATFSGTAWLLRNFYGNPYAVPVGGLLPYTGDTAPNSNFVLPAGQAISRTTYAAYFALVGTRFGSGDGSTTFNVPDLRGRVIAALDNLGGSAASRLTATYLGASSTSSGSAGGIDNHAITSPELAAHTHASPALTDPGHTHGLTGNVFSSTGGNPLRGDLATYTFNSITATNSNTTGITLAATTGSTGSGTAFSVVQPTMVLSFLLRII
jgi:microcystin-dependent protein